MNLLEKIRLEGAKNNLDISSNSVNVISGKEGKNISNQIISLSDLREEIKMKKSLFKPLTYVQEFANVAQKEDDILVWGLLIGFISFLIGLLVALIKEVK
jgi:hypothetical protein